MADNTPMQDAELKIIRETDNSAREADGVQPPQDNKPLELSVDGKPVDVKFGGDA
jgi:hypothetical protein